VVNDLGLFGTRLLIKATAMINAAMAAKAINSGMTENEATTTPVLASAMGVAALEAVVVTAVNAVAAINAVAVIAVMQPNIKP